MGIGTLDLGTPEKGIIARSLALSPLHLAPGDRITWPATGAEYTATEWESLPEGWTGEDELEYRQYLAAFGARLAARDAEYDAMLRQQNEMYAEFERQKARIEASPTEWQTAIPVVTDPRAVNYIGIR